MSAAAMLVALAIEGVAGWPDRLHARIGHPVTWIGALIE
ncbi:cobalamin biosynthesis protein, partial [Rhodovulum sulfidophilum]|nr:cobalamin biosynthesis protein [Rhodovulum sulfidophilum]